MAGAEIYATVGNEDKVQFLMKEFGIRRTRIFHSRDATFLPNLLHATGGKGVDVVLNSLSGELLHASVGTSHLGYTISTDAASVEVCGRVWIHG